VGCDGKIRGRMGSKKTWTEGMREGFLFRRMDQQISQKDSTQSWKDSLEMRSHRGIHPL